MDSQRPFNFELVAPHLDLEDVSPNAPILPGDCYFVRWMNSPGDPPKSWIGVICEEAMLPADFLATRPIEGFPEAADFGIENRNRQYPVWLVGKKDGL